MLTYLHQLKRKVHTELLYVLGRKEGRKQSSMSSINKGSDSGSVNNSSIIRCSCQEKPSPEIRVGPRGPQRGMQRQPWHRGQTNNACGDCGQFLGFERPRMSRS